MLLTLKPRKPNPPIPPFLQENGGFKASLLLGERFTREVLSKLLDFPNNLLHRFTEFARSSKYVLQCDIRKYFPSIDHEILKSCLRRKIKCPETLWLIDTIIDSSNPQEPVINYFPGDDLWLLRT